MDRGVGRAGAYGLLPRRQRASAYTVEDRLVKTSQAYTNATIHLGRAPKGPAELRPYFDGGAADDATRSPNDGEEFVILWGVDYDTLPPGLTIPKGLSRHGMADGKVRIAVVG